MEREEAMRIFQDSGALLTGHFILTSGRHSDQYMQCALVLQNPRYTERLAEDIALYFSHQGVEVVIGPAMGGIIVAYEVARKLGARALFCERENGIMSLRRGFSIKEGEKVLVVEDVVTTGGSVKEVMEVVRSLKGNIVGVACLVDRGGEVDFGVPSYAVLSLPLKSYQPEECPLCREGKLPPIKPGSREKK